MVWKIVGCCGAWAAKQAEPFGFALTFWLYLLCQDKKWKTTIRGTDKSSKATKVRCSFDKLRINLGPA
jgi:hypothetical protein